MIVVACPDRAERILQVGSMRCPRCPGRLRPFGHGRTRTVRGRGDDTLRVTPRRARCRDCGGTQILLPATLTVRRADSIEVIGAALAAKAGGAGFRAIAATLARPVSTVRSWLRRVPEGHARWLYERAVDRGADRPGAAGRARAVPDGARAGTEPAGRGGAALPRASRTERPRVGVDRLLRPGPVAGPARHPTDLLISGPARARSCPAAAVTVPSTRPRLPPNNVTATTTPSPCRPTPRRTSAFQ